MKINNYIFLLLTLFVLGSCVREDEEVIESASKYTVTLRLQEEQTVDIATRAGITENMVNDILAVVLRNGGAKYEYIENITLSGTNVSFTLSRLAPKENEKLYIFCNTGLKSIAATDEVTLLQSITCSYKPTSVLPMYGAMELTSLDAISIPLYRTYAKANLSITAPAYSIAQWKVCNAPSVGYVSGQGRPTNVDYVNVAPETESGGIAYFLPRVDNDVAAVNKMTCILVELTGHGWYRLDFYKGGSPLAQTEKPAILNPVRNTFYQFTITGVKNDGYATEDEAAANIGSNVEFRMEATENVSQSNGQYLLQANMESLILYPVGGTVENSNNTLVISAVIPENSPAVTTYSLELVNPSGQIRLDGDDDKDNKIDLNVVGTPVTTTNSSRNIKLYFTGADVSDSYLIAKLGNITKKIPLAVLAANSYLFDFTQTGNTLYIPVVQANADGNTRITPDMELEAEIIWADQSALSFDAQYNQSKQWIEVATTTPFTGNAVVALKTLDGTIRWSWHIWSMGTDILEYDTEKGLYDLKDAYTKTFNGFIWMDRNLGAYDLSESARTQGLASCRGLQYQWGRKDPFPSCDGLTKGTVTDKTIYYGSQGFNIQGSHPTLGACHEVRISENNLEYSIQHPLRVISSGKGGVNDVQEYNWYANIVGSPVDPYLWISKSGTKGAFNPCPIGWTVPDGGNASPYAGLRGSDAVGTIDGVEWGDAGYYPYVPLRSLRNEILIGLDTDPPETTSETTYIYWGNFANYMNVTYLADYRVFYKAVAVFEMPLSVRCVRER